MEDLIGKIRFSIIGDGIDPNGLMNGFARVFVTLLRGNFSLFIRESKRVELILISGEQSLHIFLGNRCNICVLVCAILGNKRICIKHHISAKGIVDLFSITAGRCKIRINAFKNIC